VRYLYLGVLITMFTLNCVAQMFPCYTEHRYHYHRLYFFVTLVLFGLVIFGSWFIFFAKAEEL